MYNKISSCVKSGDLRTPIKRRCVSMDLANIEMILKIILLALKIAILVEYIIKSKKYKKSRSKSRKDKRL